MRKLSRRISKSTKQYITVCIIAILVAGGATSGVAYKIISSIKTNYESQLNTINQEMNSNKRTVYIATKDVMAGEVLTQDSVTSKTVFATQPQDTYLSASDIGKVVLIDIKTDTQILKSMITNNVVDDNIREVEYNTILISTNILENDFVDVRLAYPNGEDYVVIPKKTIKGYTGAATNCFFWLNEEEIIRMRNAVVDAYLYTGAFLYTTKYIEPNLQDASVVTYTPSIEAIKLIEENPNIIEAATNELSTLVRKALENRLAKSLKKNVAEEEWKIYDDYIYQQYEGTELDRDKQGPASEEDKTVNEVKEPDIDTEDDTSGTEESEEPVITDSPEVGANINDDSVIRPDLGDSRIKQKDDGTSDFFNITEG